MKTDESTYSDRIVIQPETKLEQELLAELFERLTNITNIPEHPKKMGNQAVYYTPVDKDALLSECDLNHDLGSDAEVTVNEHGQLAPEPGSRALVVITEAKVNGEGYAGAETQGESDQETEDGENLVEIPPELFEDLAEEVRSEDHDYDELQDLAKRLQSNGVSVPANLSTDDLIDEFSNIVGVPPEEVPDNEIESE
jgi:hypothetical protein